MNKIFNKTSIMQCYLRSKLYEHLFSYPRLNKDILISVRPNTTRTCMTHTWLCKNNELYITWE